MLTCGGSRRKRKRSVARAGFVTRRQSGSRLPSQPRRITRGMAQSAENSRRSSVANAARQYSPPATYTPILSPAVPMNIPEFEERIVENALAECLVYVQTNALAPHIPCTRTTQVQLSPLDTAGTSSACAVVLSSPHNRSNKH